VKVSKSVLEWREGDPITEEHRNALAADISRAFNLSAEKEAETREEYARIPDTNIAEALAVMIAQQLRMDVPTFRQTFPTIAREGKSMSVRQYLELGNRLSEIPSDNQLGEIG